MVWRLKRRLWPGERIVYRAGIGLKEMLYFAAVVAAAYVGTSFLMNSGDPILNEYVGSAIGLYIVLVLIYAGSDVVVTDRRILFRRSFVQPSIVALPHWKISRAEVFSGHLYLTDRSGERHKLGLAPNHYRLAEAITNEIGIFLSALPSSTARRWINGISLLMLLGLVGGMYAFAQGFGAIFDLVTEMNASSPNDIGWPGRVLLVIVFFGGAFVAMAVGSTFGGLAAVAMMRPCLSATDARAVFDTFLPGPTAPSADPGFVLHIRLVRRFACRLYGQAV